MKTRQASNVLGNTEASSCNHCWRRQAISATYSECVCL